MGTGIWDDITFCWDYAHGVRACVLAHRELLLFHTALLIRHATMQDALHHCNNLVQGVSDAWDRRQYDQ
eukprot:3666443-Pyramimonas_sp.AAC.1